MSHEWKVLRTEHCSQSENIKRQQREGVHRPVGKYVQATFFEPSAIHGMSKAGSVGLGSWRLFARYQPLGRTQSNCTDMACEIQFVIKSHAKKLNLGGSGDGVLSKGYLMDSPGRSVVVRCGGVEHSPASRMSEPTHVAALLALQLCQVHGESHIAG